MEVLSILIGLLGISFLVFIHECGHFFFCKLFTIPVASFNIGFGPPLVSKKIYNTRYNINMIPFGGSVEIESKNEDGNEVDIISQNSTIKGFFVIFGGILVNLIFPYIAITSLIIFNEREVTESKISLFSPEIVIFDSNNDSFSVGNKPLFLHLRENDSKLSMALLNTKEEISKEMKQKIIQFKRSFSDETDDKAPFQKLIRKIRIGCQTVNNIITCTINDLIEVIKKKDTKSFCGPIGIIGEIARSFKEGIGSLISILSFLSISLALMNLLPIPPLDGGQFVLLLVSKACGGRLPKSFEKMITLISIFFIVSATILSNYNDLFRLYNKYFS